LDWYTRDDKTYHELAEHYLSRLNPHDMLISESLYHLLRIILLHLHHFDEEGAATIPRDEILATASLIDTLSLATRISNPACAEATGGLDMGATGGLMGTGGDIP